MKRVLPRELDDLQGTRAARWFRESTGGAVGRLRPAAAHELGIGETTVRQHLSGLYRRTGCVNAAQAAYWLGTRQLDGDATPRAASRGR